MTVSIRVWDSGYRLTLFVISAKVRDDGFFEFQRIDEAGAAVEDFVARGDEQGIGYGAGPVCIDGLDELILIVRLIDIIGAGGLLLLQEGEDLVFLIGGIQANGNELEIAAAVHTIHIDEIGEFDDAGSAPGCPEINQEQFVGFIGD